MKKLVFFFILLCFLSFIFPVATAIIEEDWLNNTQIDTSSSDGSGNTVTLSPLRKGYTSSDGKYTITARDFDAQGAVVLDITYLDRKETVILQGEWDANRTKILFTPPVELFNKMMIITTKKIVPPAGVFTCCPEAEIHIDVLRPVLSIGFKSFSKSLSYQYSVVDPYSNWSIDPYSSPFDDSTETVSGTIEEKPNAYMINEQITVELEITNNGDAESHDNVVYIDTDDLIIESGMTYHQLSTLSGKDQKNFVGPISQNIKMKLRFPYPPKKLNYSIHGYVRGKKEGLTYFAQATMEITLLPAVKLQKSATKEIMLPSRKEVEKIYPNIDANEIYRWLQGGEVYVSLGVTNYQNYGIKGLRLTDSAGRQFVLDKQSLNWTFDLKPFETREFKYKVTALRPGTLKHPSAQLMFSDMNLTWNLRSEAPSTEVHGPCVQVYKKPDNPVIPPGSNVMITVTIRNSGDMPSRVKINDSIPENSTFIDGIMYYEGVLAPKDSAFISYNISIGTRNPKCTLLYFT